MHPKQLTPGKKGSKLAAFLIAVMCLMLLAVIPATAQTKEVMEPTMSEEDEVAPTEEGPTPQEQTVQEAEKLILSFDADPELDWFRANMKNAEGVLIIPEYYAAGLIASVGGGNGVLLVQDRNTGEWSQPAFYSAGALGVGATVGAQTSEIVVMLMSEKAIEAFQQTKFDLGGAGNVTLGPMGGVAAEDTSGELVVYGRSKGLYLSLNLAGVTIATHDDYNEAYYGKAATPKQIMANEVTNAYSSDLQWAVQTVGKKIRRCTFCRP
ncbi:MAG: lipid-binding SYLF domain-containing protein [Nitrospirota bacterium]|nr:MAG: lipid-binding SYLF domain-containing protein [Nitrospirota bacterium]